MGLAQVRQVFGGGPDEKTIVDQAFLGSSLQLLIEDGLGCCGGIGVRHFQKGGDPPFGAGTGGGV